MEGGRNKCTKFCTTGMDGGMCIWDVKVTHEYITCSSNEQSCADVVVMFVQSWYEHFVII